MIQKSPFEVGSLSHDLQGLHIPGRISEASTVFLMLNAAFSLTKDTKEAKEDFHVDEAKTEVEETQSYSERDVQVKDGSLHVYMFFFEKSVGFLWRKVIDVI